MDRMTVASPEIETLYRELGTDDTNSAVSVLLKVRGETCDIDCLYCYEKRKEAPGGARISAEQVHRLGEIFGDRPLVIELHGGEPLTAGKDHIAAILTQLAAQPSVIGVSIQTNGLALDDAWLDLFDAHYPALRIGISLDGDARGNAWRVDYDGAPAYPRIAATLRLLGERGRKAGIIAAVTPAVLGRAAAVIDHLAAFEAVNAVNFAPCFDSMIRRTTASAARRLPTSRVLQQGAVREDSAPGWAVTPGEYAEFVLATASQWISAGHYRRIKLEPVVSTIRRIRGLNTSMCHFSDLKCDHVFTLYPDGRLGSCDELPWPRAELTTLRQADHEPAVSAAQQRSPLLGQLRTLMSKCAACEYRGTCAGGCLATRVRLHESAGDDDAYCDYRMRLIDGVAGLLAQPGDLRAALCRTLRWRPREVNQMRDVAGFLARWDDPAATRQSATLLRSPYGNINTVGLPGTHEADDLDPAHRQWADAIEPGARSLVDTVTAEWGWVTYDSCEGHAYKNLNMRPRIRQIGILPRDRSEYTLIANALCRAATAASAWMPDSVRLVVGRAELTCEATASRHPVLDLRLEPGLQTGWQGYFAHLDAASDLLAEVLRGMSRTAWTSCACQPVEAPR
jgi:uncharacterized protein